MDLRSLTNEELEKALQAMQESGPEGVKAADQVQEVLHELQVHRMELEMQNRALRESQAELEQTIRRYTDLYDFSPIGYLTLTGSGRIEEANLTAAELLGCERPLLIGQHFRRFLGEADGERLVLHLHHAMTQQNDVIELALQPDNQEHPLSVQLSSRLTHFEGTPQLRTAITDISALKSVQQQLLEISREQETFSYSISHDLRTPLVSISNLSTLLLSEYTENLDETGRDCLQRIHFATLRMDQLLTDLLEYSRISRSSIQSSTVEVEQVVDDILGQHHGIIETTQAKVSVKRPLPRVRGAPEALRQVLANLLTNALKFVAPGQKPEVEFTAHSSNGLVVLVVQDHGIGIPAEHRQRIFGMFERLHGQSRYPGTGIGLAIVRRAVERMGGRIWIESEEGKGSSFFVELPAG